MYHFMILTAYLVTILVYSLVISEFITPSIRRLKVRKLVKMLNSQYKNERVGKNE